MAETVYRVEHVQSGDVSYTRYEQCAIEIMFDLINVEEVNLSDVPPYGHVQLNAEGYTE